MKIAEVVPKNDFRLYIKTVDGRTGVFDVKPYLKGEAFAPLRDDRNFTQVRNGGYFVSWDCGADLSADTIQAHWEPISQPATTQG